MKTITLRLSDELSAKVTKFSEETGASQNSSISVLLKIALKVIEGNFNITVSQSD